MGGVRPASPHPGFITRGRAIIVMAVLSVQGAAAQETDTLVANYAAHRRGMVSFETPEVFELANIVLSLTPGGEDPNSTFRGTDYFETVRQQFRPFRDHAVVRQAGFEVRSRDIQRYFHVRDNAFRYCFDGDRIVTCTPHPASFPVETTDFWDEDGIALLEDFARVTGFRRFYAEQRPVYDRLAREYRRDVDLTDMRLWLETNFSARWDSFRILFSPLIGASHSAHRFEPDGFREAVMLTASPPRVDSYVEDPVLRGPELALMIFTELDHLYVNPATERLQNLVEDSFSNLDYWADESVRSWYSSPFLVFNEYMTWAVFIFWAEETYEHGVAESIEDRVGDTMTRRGFPRFAHFMTALRTAREEEPDATPLESLYPRILGKVAMPQEGSTGSGAADTAESRSHPEPKP